MAKVSSSHRSTGTKSSGAAPQGGGVTLKGSRQAARPSGNGQGVKVPVARVNPPKSSAKVISTRGRTVAGSSKTIKSS